MEFIQTSTSDGFIFRGLMTNTDDKETIIIHIHGMAGDFYHETYYRFMHDQYPKNNIAFLAGENRGTQTVMSFNMVDDSIKNVGNAYEVFEECVYDIQAWIDFAKALGYKKIFLQGHSLGPSKIMYYLDTVKPKDISGLILISPSEMVGSVHDPWGFQFHKVLLPEATQLVADGNGDHLLSELLWDNQTISAKTYLNLFSDDSKSAIFNYLRQDLGWDVVSRINLPVLAITGTKDDGVTPFMDPVKAMDLLKEKFINSSKVVTRVYDGAEHSFEEFEQNIVDDAISFINDVLQSDIK
jgi:pimeloyl-ACP methyl ester carboxylesterase